MNGKEKPVISNGIIAHVAYDIGIWYKTTFVLALHLAQSSKDTESNPFKLPWSEESSIPFKAERYLFVMAAYHALDGICKLNDFLIEKEDSRLSSLKERISDTNNLHDRLKSLRNMHEHSIEYIEGCGHKQNSFNSTVHTKMGDISTNAHWFLNIPGEMFIGDINVLETLKQMFEHKDELMSVLEEIWNQY